MIRPFDRARNMLTYCAEQGTEVVRLKPTVVPIRNGDMIGIYCPRTHTAQARLILNATAEGILVGVHDVRPIEQTTRQLGRAIEVFGVTNGGRWAPARSEEGVDSLCGLLTPSGELELWGQRIEGEAVAIPADEDTVGIFAEVCMNALSRRFDVPRA